MLKRMPVLLITLGALAATPLAHANDSAESATMVAPLKQAIQIPYQKNLLSRQNPGNAEVSIHHPGSAYIQLYFSRIALPKGALIEVSSPDGAQFSLYGHHDFAGMQAGKDQFFSPLSISGDSAIIKVIYPINHRALTSDAVYLAHYEVPPPKRAHDVAPKGGRVKRSIVGSDERLPSVCLEALYPRSLSTAAAKTGGYGTAWSVGSGNTMMTNHHVVRNQSALGYGEIWFNYASSNCSPASEPQNIVKIKPATLITTGSGGSTDYTLFSLDPFDYENAKIKYLFGSYKIKEGVSAIGEPLYIPQHGNGGIMPQRIAYTKAGQACRITSFGANKYTSWYNCDTQGGSSGSPVLSLNSNEVVALHYAGGGSSNVGVSSWYLWDKIKHFMPASSNVEVPAAGKVSSTTINFSPLSKRAVAKEFPSSESVLFEVFDGKLTHFGTRANGYSTIAVKGKDAISGAIVPMVYRLSVKNTCGYSNLEKTCAASSSGQLSEQLLVTFNKSDNPDLSQTSATTAWIALKVRSKSTLKVKQNLLIKVVNNNTYDPFVAPFPEADATVIDMQIGKTGGSVSKQFDIDKGLAFVAAYAEEGPTALVWAQGGYTALKVPVKNATGEMTVINLRGTRGSRCPRFSINSAVYCQNYTDIYLQLAFKPEDNKDLAPGNYQGILPLYAKSHFDSKVMQPILVNIDIVK